MNELFSEANIAEYYKYAIIGGVIRIVIWLLFAWTVYATLKLMRKENRCILPSQAWFIAIPLFNIYWNFEVVRRLADSFNNEYYDRKIEAEGKPTQRQGLMYAWTFLLSNIPFPTTILVSIAMLNFIYFVMYWVKVSQQKSLLKLHIDHYGKDYIAKEDEN